MRFLIVVLCLVCLTSPGTGQRLSTVSGTEGSELLLSNHKKSSGSFAGDKFQTDASRGLANGERDKVAGIAKHQRSIESASYNALGAENPAKGAGKVQQGSLPPNPGNPQALAMPAIPPGSSNDGMGRPSREGSASIRSAVSPHVEESLVSTSATAANQIGQRRQAEQGSFALQPQLINSPAIQNGPSTGQGASNTIISTGNTPTSIGASQASASGAAGETEKHTVSFMILCSVCVWLSTGFPHFHLLLESVEFGRICD
jgi:hypothetical protein